MSSVAGSIAIVASFESILQTNLQTALDAAVTDLGASYSLTAPSSTTGYSRSRSWPTDTTPAIRIVKVSAKERDEIHCLGAPRREDSVIEVSVQLADDDPYVLEERLALYVAAIRRTVLQYWRTEASTTYLQEVTTASEDAASSLRERFSQEGLLQYGGQVPQSNHERASVFFYCTQAVYAPINFS